MTEFITLEDRYVDVFREPAIVEAVCRHTRQKIRRLKKYDRYSETQTQTVWWAYLAMISSTPKDLHPRENRSKMSINGHISMARLIAGLAQQRAKELAAEIASGVTYVQNVERRDNGKRIVIFTHPAQQTSLQKGGHIILISLLVSWNEYTRRINESLEELLRLRQLLDDGWCDGDFEIKEEVSNG